MRAMLRRLRLLLGHRKDRPDKLFEERRNNLDLAVRYAERGLFLLKLAKVRAEEEHKK